MKKLLENIGRTFVLALLVTRCATQGDSGSQTHWLATCDRDSECGPGLLCRCGRCMKTCESGACTGLDRAAECVASSSPAHDAVCDASDDTSICLPTCEGGCRSDERCVSGSCAPRSVPSEGGPSSDGRPCPDLGACKDGGKEAGPGLDGSTESGVPCAECDLPTQIARLAGPTSEDCGRISVDAGGVEGTDCAHAAFQAARPFTLVMDLVGTDSFVATAWVFIGGRVHVLTYDSNICGGGPSCENPRCGPRVSEVTCTDPMPSTVPRTVFECSQFNDYRAMCEPMLN